MPLKVNNLLQITEKVTGKNKPIILLNIFNKHYYLRVFFNLDLKLQLFLCLKERFLSERDFCGEFFFNTVNYFLVVM